jgi:Flp pilus assembly protein TadD
MTARPAPADKGERREEALRPSRCLGYDRDTLAMHLMSREVFDVAESQFRRAVWLNPFQPRFKWHLAWCLYRQGRLADARHWAAQAVVEAPRETEFRRLLDLIENRLADQGRDQGRQEG